MTNIIIIKKKKMFMKVKNDIKKNEIKNNISIKHILVSCSQHDQTKIENERDSMN